MIVVCLLHVIVLAGMDDGWKTMGLDRGLIIRKYNQ
jgi:hypothetical protein